MDDVAVPETLTALIAARLDGLDPADRALLEDAAVLGQSFTVAGLVAVSGTAPDALESRLRALVRRELLVLNVDPRSPERGQYTFVQGLIREVAYNTLSKRDRKTRHLAAARFFESLGSDELAGGLAGHYLAAQRLAADPAEADALAAQARIALRGAAERAAALGSHEQALAFLEPALAVTVDPADRAELHARAIVSAMQGLNPEVTMRHAEAAVAERRKGTDRAATASALASLSSAIANGLGDPERARILLIDAWEEFSDLEQEPAGVDLMIAMVRVHRGLNDSLTALKWVDRVLPIAERLRILPATARGLVGRGSTLITLGRPREGIALLRGVQQLALQHDIRDVELPARVLLTFFEQWGEPALGLALARDGLDIVRRLGSRSYGANMVGNGTICAFRIGEWEWAATVLEEWIAVEGSMAHRAEFYVDRAILRALRGDDGAPDVAEARSLRLAAGITDPQWETYELWAGAWSALATNHLADARRLVERGIEITDYFAPLLLPIAARAALWEGDRESARAAVEALETASFVGPALEADRATAAAGLAALEGRGPDAVAGYREAFRAYRQLGLAFDEALAVVDMAALLPPADQAIPEVEGAISEARIVLARLGAQPFLQRLVRGSVSAVGSDRRGAGSLSASRDEAIRVSSSEGTARPGA